MGIYDRQYYQNESRPFSLEGLTGGRSIVFVLIGINVAVFLLDAIFGSRQGGVGSVSELLKVSVSDATQPWYWFRFLTYGFAHANPSHLFGNMIGLFFFGRAAEAVYGSRKFLWMYLTAILAGGLIWMLFALLVGGQGGAVLGASGGVAAVVILFCINFPNQKVFLLFLPFVGIPAWILGVFYVGADLFGMFGLRPESNVAFVVHLVGAAYAWVFYKTRWELSEIIPGLSSGGVSLPSFSGMFKPKLRVHKPSRQEVKDEQLAEKADKVLQKLHQQGEASLSARERRILEDYSNRIKQRR